MKAIEQPSRFSFGALLVMALPVVFAMQHPGIAMARDNVQHHPIAEAMETATAKSFTGVSFYFHGQQHSPVKKHIGTYTARRTTNAFGKAGYAACQWGFLSAVKTLYERALAEGGNAVINISSITTGQVFDSADDFVCRAGNVVAKVYLRGDVVLL